MEDLIPEIKRLSEKYRQQTAENLSKLVRIKSLSMGEEAVQKELMRQMKEAGFDEVRIDGLGNVIGRLGNGSRLLAIDGHIDTVDTGNRENWTFDPLGGVIKDGFVHGRGSVDQKGGVAAFVTAGRILSEIGFKSDMTVLFTGTVMEEDCDGLCWKYIIEEDRLRPDFVLITEPTNLNISRGQRGRMEIRVHFQGISSHGSAPERGKNAIFMASRAALEIEKLNDRLQKDPFLGKGSITVTEIISGSPSLCAVPDYARIHIDRRLTAGETMESALSQVNQVLEAYNARTELLSFREKAWTGLEYGMDKYYPTWQLPAGHFLVRTGASAFRGLYGKDPEIDKWIFSTNGIMTCGVYGIPTIGFGPGNEALAHAPDEKVPVDDLVTASAFYAAFALELGSKI